MSGKIELMVYRRKPNPKICEDVMCFGTPGEITKLVNAGYVSILNLMVTPGRSGGSRFVWMIQITINENGCAMYKDGKCLLQEQGLTPEMGKRYLTNDHDGCKKMFDKAIRAWDDMENIDTIIHCLESVQKQNNDNHLN